MPRVQVSTAPTNKPTLIDRKRNGMSMCSIGHRWRDRADVRPPLRSGTTVDEESFQHALFLGGNFVRPVESEIASEGRGC